MKQITLSLITGSLLASTLLFSGCGESANTSMKAPKDTSKLIRAVSTETDWTWFVGTDGTQNGNHVGFTTYFMQGIPSEVKHFQYFLDTDNNADTGFSFGQDSWRISGADILVEDGAVYQSASKSAWKWNYIGELDDYTKSTVEGIQQINFNANKSLLSITSNKVNVTIEPFDAAWGSTYSTISTQVVPLIGGDTGNQQTPEEILKERFQQNAAALISFVYTPQQQGAVVLSGNQQGETLALYGLENPQNPLHEYDIDAGDEASTFSDIKMLGDGKIQYVRKDSNGQESHTYTITYDYFHKKQISKVEIGADIKTSIENTLNKNVQGHVHYTVNSAEKLDSTHYLVSFRLETGGDGHDEIVIFDTTNQKIIYTLQNVNIDGGSGTARATNIKIHQNNNTITYDRVMKFWDPRYQNNFINTEHATVNFKTAQVVDSYFTQEAHDTLKSKIRHKSMETFHGLPQKIYGYGKNVYVVSHRTKFRNGHLEKFNYFIHYDVSDINNIVEVTSMPVVDYDHIVDKNSLKIKIGTDKDAVFLEYTVPSKNIKVIYNTSDQSYTTVNL